MKFIVGKKLAMTQVFLESGEVVPVTLVQADPCVVTQVKSGEKDGYTAVQVGYGDDKRVKKPQRGHSRGLADVSDFTEFRVSSEDISKFERGQVITTEVFVEGEMVEISGISKGKGFQGVVKRHHFAGQGGSHGVKDQMRMPGSSGSTAGQRTFKNVKKPGRMGGDKVTVKNLVIVKKDDENRLLYVKGALPGGRGGVIEIISNSGDMDLKKPSPVIENKPVAVQAPTPEAVEPKVEVSEVEEVKA